MSCPGYIRTLFALLPQGRCEKKRVCVCACICVHVIIAVQNQVSPLRALLSFLQLHVQGEAVFLPLTIISDITLFYDTADEEMLWKTCAELSK